MPSLRYIRSLRFSSFIQPISTRIHVQNWYNQGQDVIQQIVDARQQLVQAIQTLINKEISQLQNRSEQIRVKHCRRS